MKFSIRFIFSFLLFFPISSFAVDLDDDGIHELFFWTGGTQSKVSVHSTTGALRDTISIPPTALEEPPVLFQGRSGNTAIVYSLKFDKKNDARLLAFSSAGKQGSIPLGALKKGTILLENIDTDPSTDILYTDKKGQVLLIANPLTDGTSPQPQGVKVKTKKERFTVIGELIARYGFGKKKTRRITTHGSDGKRTKLKSNLPKNALLYPLHDAHGVSSTFFGTETSKKNGALTTHRFYDILNHSKSQIKTTKKLSPGYFVSGASQEPQFATSDDLTIQFFSVTDPTVPLQEVQLDFGNTPPPTNPGTENGSGGSTNGSCNKTFPQSQLNQAVAALNNGDYLQFQQIFAQISAGNYCADILAQIATFLNQGLFSAVLPTPFTLLGPPVYSTASATKKKAGCAKLKGNSDGAGGWILKASDENGKLVTLSPANYGSTEAQLVKPSGKIIEKLKYTGPSNGFRGTFRGAKSPQSYPKHLIVRFAVNSTFGGEPEYWCFETKNSHVRND